MVNYAKKVSSLYFCQESCILSIISIPRNHLVLKFLKMVSILEKRLWHGGNAFYCMVYRLYKIKILQALRKLL